ncbi:DoxX family protein [Nocardiopsis listeri]|uniref:DoxX family protein n=1 Tax=Nocardiopsis listeri TaxID=53440 RepID=UPI00083006CD|nr:hypothetical protein [Nocardiopsis listeri]
MQQGSPRPSPPLRARGRLYDVAAAATRVGVGWFFAEFGLSLRGREHLVAERLSDSGLTPLAFFVPLLPALLVAFSVSFAVGLLTWLTGPTLALAAVVGTLGAGTEHLSPFDSWGMTALVTAVCVLMAMSGGRWSWDHLVLGLGTPALRRGEGRTTSTACGKAPAISHRRPEHAPPLLYPVEQAELRRPYRM